MYSFVGIQLKEIVEWRKTNFSAIGGNRIAIDGHIALYQFLSIIRQKDGTPLMNTRGEITSHLSGILYRTAKLVDYGVRPCFVFDGKPPEFKLIVKDRIERKKEAEKKLQDARVRGDVSAIRKYSEQSTKIEPRMIDESKKLLTLLGIPWVQAPSEGEAQAAYMASKGDMWASASQDFDSLLFGTPRLIKNLTITGKRKLPYKQVYIEIVPEILKLKEVLEHLGITRDELICLGMLVGTDFNPGGIKGVGPKKALSLIKEKGCSALDEFEWSEEWPEKEVIIDFFKNPPVTDDYNLEWRAPDTSKVLDFLVGEQDFSETRVLKALDNFRSGLKKGKQTQLEEWFR